MKVRELAILIANIGAIATSLGQIAESARTAGDGKVTLQADDLGSVSERLMECCNALGQLIPDVELELDDASHRNDE